DLDGRARLAVQLAVAVHVLLEMTVDAVHPLLEVDVAQVHGLLESLGVVRLHRGAGAVEQLPFAVLLQAGAEDPAVAVEAGELRPREPGSELRDVGEELGIGPSASR